MDHDHRGRHDHEIELQEVRRQLREAAILAEQATGRHERTISEARTSLILRAARTLGGFALVGIGIVLLPLPGPGWVVIIVGLTLLPFGWAQRMVRLIRSRVPGVPEDGRIPFGTWIVMALLLAAVTAVSILFGKQIGHWVSGLWEQFWS